MKQEVITLVDKICNENNSVKNGTLGNIIGFEKDRHIVEFFNKEGEKFTGRFIKRELQFIDSLDDIENIDFDKGIKEIDDKFLEADDVFQEDHDEEDIDNAPLELKPTKKIKVKIKEIINLEENERAWQKVPGIILYQCGDYQIYVENIEETFKYKKLKFNRETIEIKDYIKKILNGEYQYISLVFKEYNICHPLFREVIKNVKEILNLTFLKFIVEKRNFLFEMNEFKEIRHFKNNFEEYTFFMLLSLNKEFNLKSFKNMTNKQMETFLKSPPQYINEWRHIIGDRALDLKDIDEKNIEKYFDKNLFDIRKFMFLKWIFKNT